MKRPAVVLALLFLIVLATRLCHAGLVWVEEAYPAAAAIQILHGQVPYRDFWFDKPPLAPLFYLLWGAYTGVALRVAGALFVLACCGMAYRVAREVWSEREGLIAAVLLGFFLTFDVPSAVMALAPDLLMLLPHLIAIWLARRGRAFASGAAAGAAMLVNPKGVLVLGACLLWARRDWLRMGVHLTHVRAVGGVSQDGRPRPRKGFWLRLRKPDEAVPRDPGGSSHPGAAGAMKGVKWIPNWLQMLAGFAAVNALGIAGLGVCGALSGYWRQVWAWGAIYSRDTFVGQPGVEALRRTSAWAGFHATIVLCAGWYYFRDRSGEARRMAGWTVLALAGVVLGWRFFPRYYFLLLPPVTIAAARGWTLVPRRWSAVVGLLLLIPLVRFGPRYVTLAADLVNGRETQWADVAMSRDSAQAAGVLSRLAQRNDTLLVWGYRPDIFMRTRMAAGTPFLDSQPLTGVIADRHLTRSEASAPQWASANRRLLTTTRPSFIVDGLGLYNPALAITRYPDLAGWLAQYEEAARTAHSVVYRLLR